MGESIRHGGSSKLSERSQSMEPDQSRPVRDMAQSRSLHEQQTDGHWLRANGSVLQPQSLGGLADSGGQTTDMQSQRAAGLHVKSISHEDEVFQNRGLNPKTSEEGILESDITEGVFVCESKAHALGGQAVLGRQGTSRLDDVGSCFIVDADAGGAQRRSLDGLGTEQEVQKAKKYGAVGSLSKIRRLLSRTSSEYSREDNERDALLAPAPSSSYKGSDLTEEKESEYYMEVKRLWNLAVPIAFMQVCIERQSC